jgi:hypothetical protein
MMSQSDEASGAGIPPADEVLQSDIEEEAAGEVESPSEYDALKTDQLRPESESETETDAPDVPSPATRQGVLPEEEGRSETLDERLAQEEPDLPRDAL